VWQSQLYCLVQPGAALELARTRSHRFTLARPPVGSHYLALNRTCSHSLALVCASQNSIALARPPVGTHSLEFAHTSSHALARPLVRTLSNSHTFSRTLSNSLSLNGRIQLPVSIFTRASLSGPLYLSPCKISAKSDYPRLSSCDLTNLCLRCVCNMFYLHNSLEISFRINIPNMV